jgi:pimeloyl-ACP methyl ester carboxylesterase
MTRKGRVESRRITQPNNPMHTASSFMWRPVLAAALAASTLSAQSTVQYSMVDVGGHKLHVQVAGTARPGTATVVFESGLGSPVGMWLRVQKTIAESTLTIAYDRSGINKSELGKDAPTVPYIVSALHTLLSKLEAPAPYVLVGHSWGGPIINRFAATYPNEVAALVYVDPTDWTQTKADMSALWKQAGVKDDDDMMTKMLEKMPGVPAGILAEAKEVARLQKGGFDELRQGGDAPDVPTYVLLGGKRDPTPPGQAFPGDMDAYFKAGMEQRIDHFGGMMQRKRQGTLVLTSKSGHFVHSSEPELVVWAIRQALAASAKR